MYLPLCLVLKSLIKVTQWRPVLQALVLVLPLLHPTDSCFTEQCYCSPAVAPEAELISSSTASAGCQLKLCEPLAYALSFSNHTPFHTAQCVGLYSCQMKAQWIWTNIIVPLSLHLALPSWCCNGDDNRAATSKQPQSILRLEGQDEGQVTETPRHCCT